MKLYRIDEIKTINDSQKIIIGSEGTLGIILSAKLKIKDKPKKRILFVIEYKSDNDVQWTVLDTVPENSVSYELNQVSKSIGQFMCLCTSSHQY